MQRVFFPPRCSGTVIGGDQGAWSPIDPARERGLVAAAAWARLPLSITNLYTVYFFKHIYFKYIHMFVVDCQNV